MGLLIAAGGATEVPLLNKLLKLNPGNLLLLDATGGGPDVGIPPELPLVVVTFGGVLLLPVSMLIDSGGLSTISTCNGAGGSPDTPPDLLLVGTNSLVPPAPLLKIEFPDMVANNTFYLVIEVVSKRGKYLSKIFCKAVWPQ